MTGPAWRDLAVISCAVSAGVHAGLVREHLAESPALGVSFAVATALLAACVLALVRRPDSRLALAATASTLAGLIASYALAITTGLPVLQPERESVEGIAVATKVVEAIGLYAALGLLAGRGLINPERKES